jgi:hypothetical protein
MESDGSTRSSSTATASMPGWSAATCALTRIGLELTDEYASLAVALARL